MEECGDPEFHGCMNAFCHLFDFDRSRKILPPQSGGSQEAPNNSAEKPSQCGINNEEKKRMAMPNVNVVARLMGLDRMGQGDDEQSRSSPRNSKPTMQQLSLSKSRSLNTLSEALDPSVEIGSQKLQLRSHSFREHPHPQEKQLQEFKRDFEATQVFHYRDFSYRRNQHNNVHQRSDGVASFLVKDTLTESEQNPAAKRQNQSREFNALEYLKRNEKIFLRALHYPNSLLATQIHSQYTPKAPSHECCFKESGSPRISSSCLTNQNQAIPLNSKSSKNSVNPLLPKIGCLEPKSEIAKQTKQQLKTYKEFRFRRDIPQNKEKKSKELWTRNASQELDSEDESSGSVSSLRTSRNSSAKGEEVFSNATRVSSPSGTFSPRIGMHSSPRLRKEIRKEDNKAVARKQSECLRDSGEKKLSSNPCSVTSRNRDAHDRIIAGPSSSGKFTIGSSKKGPHHHNLISKAKPLNKKITLALANYKDKKTGVTGKSENALPNNVLINTEDETEGVFLECPVANRVDECEEVLGGIGEKCEFPSPISVLDGPFQHESPIPSPVNIKEIATDFHELRTKLCSLKSNVDDTMEFNQYGRVLHQDDTFKLTPKDKLLAPKKEVFSDKRSHLSETQSSIRSSLKVDDIIFPEGKEANLLYVRNVLVFAGFNDDNILAFTRWYSPSHPIDPQVFNRLEEYYHDEKPNNPCMNSSSSGSKAQEKSKDVANRKILFEVVDEIICRRIKLFFKTRAWIRPTKRNLRYMSTGKQLLKEVWDEICRFPEADCEILEDVESLVYRDMANEAPWFGDDEDIEKVGLQLEQYIFDNLLQQVVFDLLSV